MASCRRRVLTAVAVAVHEPLGGCAPLVQLISSFIDYSTARWSFRDAARRGSVHLLEFVAVSTVWRIPSREFEAAMLAAVKNRDFAVVQWLQGYSSNSGLSYRVLDEAAASGAFAIAQWLVDQRPPRSLSCSGRGVSSVAKRGDLSMLKWLEEFCVGGFPAAAIDLAASAGHLEIVEWMHARNYECTNMAMSGAAANGYMAVVKWLHGNRTEGCTRRAMDGAAERGALEIVQWLHEHRQEGCSAAAMDGAAANGHLTVVQWLHENRTEGCSVNAMNDAAWNGHLHVVQWLHEHRAEGCTNKALQFAVASGHLSVVQFLVENRTEGDHRLAALRATSSGHLEMLQYLLQSCPEFTFRHEDLLGLARRSKHPHIVQWLEAA